MGKVKEYICENKYLMRYIKDKELSTKVSSSDSYRKILRVCPDCNNEYMITPSEVKRKGFKCKICKPRFKESIYDNEYMRKYVVDVEKSKFISSSYTKENIEWSCPKCSRTVYNTPLNIKISGFRCPECNPLFEESVYDNEYMRNYVKNKECSKIISSKSEKKLIGNVLIVIMLKNLHLFLFL